MSFVPKGSTLNTHPTDTPIVPSPSGNPTPTIQEALQSKSKSPAYKNMMRVCAGLTSLIRRIEPFLEGTPLETPVAVFTAIADVVEVCLVSCTLPWR